MGNESCKLKGLEIAKTAVEVNDFWTLSNAIACTTTTNDGKQHLSIFQGELVANEQLWLCQGPMERVIRNLMIFRHPYILRFITNWEQAGHKYLATERVQPLQTVIMQQSDIQICLGLRSILCALIFLIEKAIARHLNICIKSIYVTETGNWRLAGFEYVWKAQDVNKSLLDLARPYRYENAIGPKESTNNEHAIIDGIEQYAFATLCEDIFKQSALQNKHQQQQYSVPHVQDFREYCSNHLKHKNEQMRPKLSAILLHPYFNHEFALIHAFFFELPLKDNREKQEFFVGLIDRLRYFDENLVASQFANDLLSRMVLLDGTAQICVIPFALHTKSQNTAALFSANCYRKYLLPIILKMFLVRDAQMRLILLEYFHDYVHLMAASDVHEYILPYLKVGLNDTNELLVAKTLQAMAELIPILGATIVLGCERAKLFSDGRPQGCAGTKTTRTYWTEPRSITPVLDENLDIEECAIVSGSPLPCLSAAVLSKSGSFSSSLSKTFNSDCYIPPRLSPDGGEDVKSPLNIDTDAHLDENKKMHSLKRNQSTLVTDEDYLIAVNEEIKKVEEEDEDVTWSDWDNDASTIQQPEKSQSCNLKSKDPDQISNSIYRKNVNDQYISHNLAKTKSSHVSLSDSSYYTVKSSETSSPIQSQSQSESSLKLNAASIATAIKLPTINDDFSQLDIQIKVSTSTANKSDINVSAGHVDTSSTLDFFKDMEPVIQSCQKFDVNVMKPEQQIKQHPSHAIDITGKATTITAKKTVDIKDISIDSNRFAAFPANEENNIGGWNCDDDDLDISTTLKTLSTITKTKTTEATLGKSISSNALSSL